MPPLETLSQWIRVMVWVIELETGGVSMCAAALRENCDPAARYRLVKKLLGLDWKTLRSNGFTWLLMEFLTTCIPKPMGHPNRAIGKAIHSNSA